MPERGGRRNEYAKTSDELAKPTEEEDKQFTKVY